MTYKSVQITVGALGANNTPISPTLTRGAGVASTAALDAAMATLVTDTATLSTAIGVLVADGASPTQAHVTTANTALTAVNTDLTAASAALTAYETSNTAAVSGDLAVFVNSTITKRNAFRSAMEAVMRYYAFSTNFLSD